ncbi:hypothetical protein YTPLAS18_16760 [Nitrospira sp.]|nr:hypothetical protein YTPLAS18_16760 [Nitrospira sp.]
MPFSTLDRLADRYADVSLSNQRMLRTFAAVAGQLRAQRIRFLILKGGDLLTRLYGHFGSRPLADIDLLLDGNSIPALHTLMLENAFLPQLDGNPAYRSSDGSLALDVCTDIWYLPDAKELWARATRRTVNGTDVCAMGSTDLLIYLILYAVVHRGTVSGTLHSDLQLLLRKEPPDWELLLDLASAPHIRIPLYTGLNILIPDLVPPSVLSTLAPTSCVDHARCRLLTQLVVGRPIPDLGHFLLWLFAPQGHRWQYLLKRLFPSKEFLAWRYGTKASAGTAVRLFRVASLSSNATRLLTRITGRLVTGGASSYDRVP